MYLNESNTSKRGSINSKSGNATVVVLQPMDCAALRLPCPSPEFLELLKRDTHQFCSPLPSIFFCDISGSTEQGRNGCVGSEKLAESSFFQHGYMHGHRTDVVEMIHPRLPMCSGQSFTPGLRCSVLCVNEQVTCVI